MLSESYNNIALAMNTKKLTLMDKLDRKSFYESRAKYESPEKLAFIEKMKKKLCKSFQISLFLDNKHKRTQSFNSVLPFKQDHGLKPQ